MAAAAPVTNVRKHRFWVWALIVVASFVTLVSSLTIFVQRQALNSQAWSNVSVRLLQDPAIRDALSVYMVDQLFKNVDVQKQLEDVLPKQTKSLAGPAAALLRQFGPKAASEVLAQPAVQDQWQNLNYQAHQSFMAIINGKSVGPVQNQQGQVVLDLHPIVQSLADRLGFSAQVTPETGRLVVFKSDQLKLVQDTVKAIKVLSVFLVVLVFLLYAAAIWAATGWRRVALRTSGWSLVIVGIVLLFVRRVVGNEIVSSLVRQQSEKTAASHAWLIGSSLLSDVAWATITYGLAVVIAAWIAGPTRPMRAFRRWLAPALRERAGFVWGAAAILVLLIAWWGPTSATQQWWGILLLAALVALGAWALQRETLQEFPDATGGATVWPDVRAAWHKVRGPRSGGSEPPDA